MGIDQYLKEALYGLKDPVSSTDIISQIRNIDVHENGSVKVLINISSEETNYQHLEKEIAQRILAFEGICQVQIEFC